MCQTPAMASPPSPPPPSPRSKLLNAQPKAHTISSDPSPPQPNQKPAKQQSDSLTTTPKLLLNPKAQPFKPLSPSEHQQYSPSKAFFLPNELLEQQQLQCTFAAVMTRLFAFQHVYYCQPMPLSSSEEAKVEFFNVFQPPVQGNAVLYFLGSSSGENYMEEEFLGDDTVDGYEKKKMDGHIKRFVPKRRSQRRNVLSNANKIWALKKFVPKKKDGEMMPGRNTTLMIKNIPNQLERHDLLDILDDHCMRENLKGKLHSNPCRSEYDFVYLPMDFGYRANLGYAFVNFTTAVGATRFSKAFHRYEWDAQVPGSKKICEVSGAAIQGKDALMYHFEVSKFRCHTDDYLPVILSPPRDGWKLSNPTIVGKRIDTGQAAAIHRRKIILMMRNRQLQ